MQADRPAILVFPPLALLMAIVVASLLAWLVPVPGLAGRLGGAERALGVVISGAGVVLAVLGSSAFRRAGTNVNPTRPALKVVRGGIYRLSRNPMYLGMVLLTAGLSLVLASPWYLIAAVVLWATLHWGAVLPEERYMEAKFGDSYRALLAETRRWL